MVDTPEVPAEQESDPFALAEPVSQRVQIQSIILAESHVTLRPEAIPKERKQRRIFGIPDVGVARPAESTMLFVKARFSLQVSKPEEAVEEEGAKDAEKPYLTIEATFVLTYFVDSFENLQDENLRAFAATNGIYNAWPYWREYVQSTISRMGQPPITVPVFRL